jgi:hypothetical protein
MARSSDASPGADQPYRVLIDDNFHFMDEASRTTGPTFATYAEAVCWCQAFLEQHLLEMLRPGMSGASLIAGYKGFGEDPWITPEPEGEHFSAWEFVEAIADRVCARGVLPEGHSSDRKTL